MVTCVGWAGLVIKAMGDPDCQRVTVTKVGDDVVVTARFADHVDRQLMPLTRGVNTDGGRC